jgi:hypothetical protein
MESLAASSSQAGTTGAWGPARGAVAHPRGTCARADEPSQMSGTDESSSLDASGSLDSASAAVFGLGILAGIVELFYRPFLLAPIGLLIVLAGALMSGRYRRLGLVAIFVIATFFVVGAAFAVWDTRALY